MTLLQALKFISVAQKEKDVIAPYQNHCILTNGFVSASNSILSAGCKVQEDLECRPQTRVLINALSNCGDTLSITQLENARLSIKSGKFSTIVPCHAQELPKVKPDPQIALISDVLKTALSQVSHLAKDEAKTVLESAILLQAGTVIATTGFVILESWHGVDLPTCVLPKVFVNAVCDCDTKLRGFGYSSNSVTFWFEDDSWIKSQIYAERYPDVSKVLNANCEFKPLTEGFYDAIRMVEDFAEGGKEKGIVVLSGKGVKCKEAFYEIEGLPDGFAFKIKQLKQVEKVVKQVCFVDNKLYVFGDNIRGVIQGVRV